MKGRQRRESHHNPDQAEQQDIANIVSSDALAFRDIGNDRRFTLAIALDMVARRSLTALHDD